jgi:N,N'-diacetyllegionaminate synthase
MRNFSILGKEIGPGRPTYCIAEAGVNHNGDVEMALELVRQAKRAGADCIKFQTFKAEAVVTSKAPKANYQLKVTDPGESQLAMLKRLELDRSAYQKILDACEREGIHFLSTPYYFDDADFLNELGVGGFKIASGQLVETPFLEYVAKLGKPLIVSTGMATFAEVREAVEALRRTSNEQFAVLQCTTNYPTELADANVLCMDSFREELGVIAGFSDHTTTSHAILAAVARGASIIEKHFTLDRKLPGPDHSSSLEPAELRQLMLDVRAVELALGSREKKPTEAEAKNIFGMRRSLVALVALEKGAVLKREHLGFKRPASGIPPKHLEQVLGRRLAKPIGADTPLTPDLLE